MAMTLNKSTRSILNIIIVSILMVGSFGLGSIVKSQPKPPIYVIQAGDSSKPPNCLQIATNQTPSGRWSNYWFCHVYPSQDPHGWPGNLRGKPSDWLPPDLRP